MERDNDKETHKIEVAVKILSRDADETSLMDDFKNELEIMKVNMFSVNSSSSSL